MPTNVLVSGAPERIAPVSKVLRDHDCTVVEVDHLANVPAACAEAGENAFDAYLRTSPSRERPRWSGCTTSTPRA